MTTGRQALPRELDVRIEVPCRAPAAAVYDVLADLHSHLEWGGRRQPKKTYKLLSLDAPDGPATVGTEFRSTGADGMGTFSDSSVVTEAMRPGVFEFVTESRLATKKGPVVEWTTVHRYEVTTRGDGSLVTYLVKVARISDLPGPLVAFRIPVLRAMLLKVAASYSRRGTRNLAALAEERQATRQKEEHRWVPERS